MCESPSTMTAFDAGLRATLLARATKHRGIRAACRAGVVLWDAVAQVDRDNRGFLSQHLVSGWVGADLVGRGGAPDPRSGEVGSGSWSLQVLSCSFFEGIVCVSQ